MPKSTMEEKDPYKLPAEIPLPAKLEGVKLKVIEFTRKKDSSAGIAGSKGEIRKWEWEFVITEGEFGGLHAWGETEDFVSRTSDGTTNKAAQWIETLRDKPLEFGEGVDTDDYLGLACAIVCKHDARERSDGQGYFYSEPVVDVFPVAILADMAAAGVGPEEPPF